MTPTSKTRADVLAELLARVEAAERPDRVLDLDIAYALRDGDLNPDAFDGHLSEFKKNYASAVECGALDWLDYTTSLDSALALCARVLPGCWREVSEQSPDHSWMAEVMDADFKVTCVSWAKTPALAVLAAMLKSLIAQEAAT